MEKHRFGAHSRYTRIQNRFTGYALLDCECRWCLYWRGARYGCPLDTCCCAEEKRLAAERERRPDTARAAARHNI